MRLLSLLWLPLGALGCGNPCERAADYRFTCGEANPPAPADACGGKTSAHCEAECVLQTDCIVFEDSADLNPERLSALTEAADGYEDCLSACPDDDEDE